MPDNDIELGAGDNLPERTIEEVSPAISFKELYQKAQELYFDEELKNIKDLERPLPTVKHMDDLFPRREDTRYLKGRLV